MTVITIILPCGHSQGIDAVIYDVIATSRIGAITSDGYFDWGSAVIEATDYSETKYFCADCGESLTFGDDDSLREWLHENTNLSPGAGGQMK